MSSYFDAAAQSVAQIGDTHDGDQVTFLIALREIEGQVAKDVSLCSGDREYPEDLREQVQGVIAMYAAAEGIAHVPPRESVVEYAVESKSSRLVEELHNVHHVLASRRVEARFGRWSDDPARDLVRRDEHDLLATPSPATPDW